MRVRSERHRDEDASRTRAGLSAEDADLLAFGLVVTDAAGAATYANRTWMAISGQTDGEWLGPGWLDVVDQSHRDADRRVLLDVTGVGHTYEADWSIVLPNDRRVLHIVAMPSFDDDGDLDSIVVTMADVTDDRARTEVLLHQATHDPLTGLYNRAQFMEFLGHELDGQRRQARLSAVLFIDVDGLKAINDQFGHDAGDRFLRGVASRIHAALRPADVVARYGGDEFVVLLEGLPAVDEAEAIASRIRDAVDMCTLSIGIAFVHPELDPHQIVAAADHAMYAVKGGGHRRRDGASNAQGMMETVLAPVPPLRPERPPVDGVGLVVAMADELRAPLTTIARYASTLRHDLSRMPTAEVFDAFIALEAQTTRLANLLNDLRDLDSMRFPAEDSPTPIALASALADALETARPPPHIVLDLPLHDVQLSSAIVPIDRRNLTRVIVKLLVNAYEHGGATVAIRGRDGDGEVRLSVEDDGPGVADDVLSQLFRPLTNGRRGAPVRAGVGLALAQTILEAYGGHVEHDRVEPHGARFTIVLPTVPPAPVSLSPRRGRGAPTR